MALSDNQQGYYKLLTACCKLVDSLEQAVGTQLVGGLLADLQQVVKFLRVYCQAPSNIKSLTSWSEIH